MTNDHAIPPQADPACHDPAEARPANCTESVPRQPDPTDRYMQTLDRLTNLGVALTEDVVAEAREAIAARRAARAATVVPEPEPAEPPAEPATLPAAEPGEPELTPEELAARDPSVLAFARMTRAIRLCMALAMRFHNDRLDRENGVVKERAVATQRVKDQLERRVKDIIDREVERDERAELKQALRECLTERESEIDLLTVPFEDMAEWLCYEIGVWTDPDDPAAQMPPPPPPRVPRYYDHPDNPDIVIYEVDIPNDPPPPKRLRPRRCKPPSG